MFSARVSYRYVSLLLRRNPDSMFKSRSLEVEMPYAAPIDALTQFQRQLVGDWENQDFGTDENGDPIGGVGNPLSYNIMPLPQVSDPDGYILKNFRYTERLHFNDADDDKTLAIAASAPNRGGRINQIARALFYEQQVRFAEGPEGPKPKDGKPGNVVHVENGAWLWLPRHEQLDGPYHGESPEVLAGLQQPSDIVIAKQIAVPHGNSILALGKIDTLPGSEGAGPFRGEQKIPGGPVIPDGGCPFPMLALPVDTPRGTSSLPPVKSRLNATERYGTKRDTPTDFQNPDPDITLNPNKPLQRAVEFIEPDYYMHWNVTTLQQPNGKGTVVDIPFEERVSDVTEYFADYWLLFKGEKKYLAYTQTILMKLTIAGKVVDGPDAQYIFPHITCNTVTYVY
jgi:hypothetical protein